MSLKALILEDDRQLGNTLAQLFTQKGVKVHVSRTVKHAKYVLALQPYNLILVDLVVPQVTGVDFLKALLSQQLLSPECQIWLMSGILSQNTLPPKVKTRINHFFKKPLDLDIINSELDKLITPYKNPHTKNFQALYMQNEISRDTKFMLDPDELIQSHELMFVYFILCLSRFNGFLNIQYEISEPVKVLFKNGHIIDFQMQDTESQIGNLLIKNNLISPEKLKHILKKQNNKLLGQHLIANGHISPHLVQKTLKEQLNLRLLKTMNNQSVKIQIDENTANNVNAFVSLGINNLVDLVDNWTHSKVDPQWLKNLFEKASGLSTRATNLPLIKNVTSSSNIANSIFQTPTQSQKLVSDFKENSFLELYCRLLIKDCYLQHNKQNISPREEYRYMKKRLEDFLLDSKRKNDFDWLNLPWKASPTEVEENYRIVINLFHPDRIDKNMPVDVKEICDKCFVAITKAYNNLVNTHSRTKYIDQIETGSAEDIMEIYSKYNKGKSELQKDNFQSAFDIFTSLLEYKKAPGDTLLYYIWARLKNNPNKILSQDERNTILKMFEKVEVKYHKTDIFYFTKGLFMKSSGYRKAAHSFFTKATQANPRMTKARQERFALKKKKKKSLFSFFKRVS